MRSFDTNKYKILEAKYILSLAVHGLIKGLAILFLLTPLHRGVAGTMLALSTVFDGVVTTRLIGRRKIPSLAWPTATKDLVSDYVSGADDIGAVIDVVPLARTLGVPDYEIGEMKTDWITQSFLKSNIALIGAGGSGKSAFLIHLTSLIIKHWGLESISGVLSTHYNSKPKDPLMAWAPGIPAEEFQKKVSRERDANYRKLKKFEQLLETRRQHMDEDAGLRFLIVDDFQHQFLDKDKKEAGQIIQRISEEGRKYNVRILFALHSLKLKNTDIDSTALWSFTVVAYLSSLLDPNSERLWPKQIQAAREQIVNDLERIAVDDIGGKHGKKLVALVWAGNLFNGWAGGRIQRLPNPALEKIQFQYDTEIWFNKAKERIFTAMTTDGLSSLTAAQRLVGVTNFRKKNGVHVNERARLIAEWWKSDKDLQFLLNSEEDLLCGKQSDS